MPCTLVKHPFLGVSLESGGGGVEGGGVAVGELLQDKRRVSCSSLLTLDLILK